MKFLRKWIKSKKRNASDHVDKRPIGVSDEERTKTVEEYVRGSSFSWFGDGPADSSIFGSDSGISDQSVAGNPVSLKEPHADTDGSRETEEDPGFDPYNTGRFDASKIN